MINGKIAWKVLASICFMAGFVNLLFMIRFAVSGKPFVTFLFPAVGGFTVGIWLLLTNKELLRKSNRSGSSRF